MRASDERILITHVGSLPRNPRLRDLLIRQERGEAIDAAELEREVAETMVWAKLRALREGADLATAGLWGRRGRM